jgi:hypothetical protein
MVTADRRTEEGLTIDFRAAGVIKITEGIQKIVAMDPTMKSQPFGAVSELLRICRFQS